MPINSNNPSSKVPYVIGAILGVAVLGTAVAWVLGLNKTGTTTVSNFQATTTPTPTDTTPTPVSANPTTTNPTPTPTPVTKPPVATGQKYKDGTYTSSGNYRTPAGNENMGVTITLAKDVVTGTTFNIAASDGTAQRYQQVFAANYKTLVVGQKLDAIALNAVSGASLTTNGFNSALAQVKIAAKI